jgi:oligosaccharide repeat unit polymerase
MGLGNPFQIYFMIWFLVIFGFYFYNETYIRVSSEFLILIFVAKLFAFTLFFAVYTMHEERTESPPLLNISKDRDRLILLAQIAVTIALPFAYLKATTLSGGDSLFSVLGYIKLRLAFTTEGESYGLLSYFPVLSYVVTSLTIFSYRQGSAHFVRLVISILVSFAYIFLSTGRTYVLLLMCLMVIPLVISRAIRLKGVLVSIFVLLCFFILIAGMTGKGISIDEGLLENIDSLSENLRSYTIAPLLALSKLVASKPRLDWGENTFRFFISLQYALGLSNIQPVALIKEFTYVPDLTNVYTVYEVYFRDFSYSGILIPPLFLVGHYWLYRKALLFGGVWIFYYSASVYPLVMQFFQDQYFSILSLWIQVAFWFWLILLLPKASSWIRELRLRNA